jgi:hypothetical protein
VIDQLFCDGGQSRNKRHSDGFSCCAQNAAICLQLQGNTEGTPTTKTVQERLKAYTGALQHHGVIRLIEKEEALKGR